jgi:hypothetical protein
MTLNPSEPGFQERRKRPRTPAPEHMMEFLMRGTPSYQLKLRDISETGAGVIVRSDSKFLSLIQTGMELDIRLITPRGSRFHAGEYRGRVIQTCELVEGPFRGHQLVGIELIA